jgi:hypothetical protein
MATYQGLFRCGALDVPSLMLRIRAWIAHLAQANTVMLRRRIFDGLVFQGPRKGGGAPRPSRWKLGPQRQVRPFRVPALVRFNQPGLQHRFPFGAGCGGSAERKAKTHA